MSRAASESQPSMPAGRAAGAEASVQPIEAGIAEAGAPQPVSLTSLWARWHVEGDSSAREALVIHHLPFARMMAASLYGRRTHNDVEFDDYLQFARVGLLEAMERFDPAQGAQFTTFASKRVQGAILNGLARFTEKQQQINLRMRLRNERLVDAKEAADAAVSPPAPGAGATGSARDPDALFRYLAEVGIGLALSVMLEDTAMIGTVAPEGNSFAPSPEVGYFRRSELERLRGALRALVTQLSEQQRMVIHHHYAQEVPFDEIARRMGVSRGRVSQLHRQGLLRLRELMGARPRFDVSG